ncbi:coiled-coil protein [Legionella lansingensis]|uniref:Coiled-coil protein n=3 Tax=Legionella lansingensis TaxID=45067 RepID=A0A0W0VF60_9GAMM|nr:coiled-coil protein [Legionella lansingensis]SNV58784.1 coiled-coil protein [Legionella lansingensis]
MVGLYFYLFVHFFDGLKIMGQTKYENQYKDFLDDKNAFFRGMKKISQDSSSTNKKGVLNLSSEGFDSGEGRGTDKFEFARQMAREHDYGFLATNKLLIEKEFNQLFATLKQKGIENDEFRFYCYYCCLMLKLYYEAYRQQSKIDEYNGLLNDLEMLCTEGRLPVAATNHDGFFTALGKKLAADIADLIDTPKKLSKLRDKVGIYNLNRIYWYFCRTTIKNSLLLARDLKWLEKLGNVLGKNIDVDNVIHILEKPNGVLRFLSVGFFAIRFIMNAGMVLKHVRYASEKERQLDWKKRFTNEVYKRHASFLNDIVWGTVNCVTNYNEFFGISAPVAGWIVAGFLLFDVCLILWRQHLEKQEYLTKRSQYLKEMGDIEHDPAAHEHYVVLVEQLRQLDLSWDASNATYWFNASAAFLLMAGFSASMVFTAPVMVLACYMVCTFAVAMYLSDGAYKEYKEKSLILEYAQLTNQGEDAALKQYQNARNELAFTLTKNTVMPALLIGTFAVCWEAAVLLAVAYTGYELYRSYSKHCQARMESSLEENELSLLKAQ